jgi:hypothetical protein
MHYAVHEQIAKTPKKLPSSHKFSESIYVVLFNKATHAAYPYILQSIYNYSPQGHSPFLCLLKTGKKGYSTIFGIWTRHKRTRKIPALNEQNCRTTQGKYINFSPSHKKNLLLTRLCFLELYIKSCCNNNNNNNKELLNASEDDIGQQLHQSMDGEEQQWETSQRKTGNIY